MKSFLKIVATVLLCLAAWPAAIRADQLQTRFAEIRYDDRDALKDFNHALYMGRLKNLIRTGETIEEEVAAKIDFIAAKVMQVLDMHMQNLKFKIVIHGSPTLVHADFRRIYNVEVKYIAFYSPSENTVFYSADNAKLAVVAHEIGHVVAENYFSGVSPPPKIHEVMAQYAEKHITD